MYCSVPSATSSEEQGWSAAQPGQVEARSAVDEHTHTNTHLVCFKVIRYKIELVSGVWTPSIVSYTIPHYSAHELLVVQCGKWHRKGHTKGTPLVYMLWNTLTPTPVRGEGAPRKAPLQHVGQPSSLHATPPARGSSGHVPTPHLHCLVPAGRPQSHAVWRYLYVGHTVAMGTPHPHQGLLERGKGSGKERGKE